MNKVIQKLSDLYIIQRGHYLIQYKNGYNKDKYSTHIAGQMNSSGKKVKSLLDWQFEKHLNGEFTVGTFGGKLMTKFITFDVDFPCGLDMAKWITYKITNTLDELGINKYYISFSGNKGYHVDMFFEDLIKNEHGKQFFNYVVRKSGVLSHSDTGNKVEFRVTDKAGVKLPMGIHQKTGRYCGFCNVEDGLKVMDKEQSESYLHTIQKMKSETILNIINTEDLDDIDTLDMIKTEDAISPHKPLKNYDQSEDYSIDRAIDLLQNGLKVKGSRNNTLFLIGLYLKYQGLEKEQCKLELNEWMKRQNPELFSTPLEQCYKEIELMINNMFAKDYNLSAGNKDLTVTFDEIKWIMEKCPEKNQKLITYAMLIHSKRHANMQGVFYMPFKDIEAATGLVEMTAISQVNKLIKLGVIEVEDRNRKPTGKGLQRKPPNLYRLSLGQNGLSQNESNVFITQNSKDIELCLKFYFTDKELKKLLPRRQYQSLIS
ncbi:TOTE conflict system archaeo-eukaryotic primase domain-containing protein [Paenibacillus sp. JSM ZJ436]|uniref:TOTE conflict system archaeo-eukaryotic primase domain-containing protein n=1 Tax=Paenibacillus sp. JSM ZJ436 TaxID=3376190 RepID=UPI0037964A9E